MTAPFAIRGVQSVQKPMAVVIIATRFTVPTQRLENIAKTLNSYGLAYNTAGANQAALRAIESANSDGDAATNIEEIRALTFPGNAGDYPGLVPAPAIGMNLERLLKLPDHSQFLFLNASNSRDFYARYRGVKILDLLSTQESARMRRRSRSFHRMVIV